MASGYIFVKDVENLIKQGKTEILVPKGARISAAAQDLIQEKEIRVIRQGEGEPLPTGDSPAAAAQETGAEPPREPEQAEPAGEKAGAGGESLSSLSEAELEALVNRVIKRFYEVKGEKAPTPSTQAGEAAPDDDVIICRCEEITKGQIKDAIRNGMHTLNGIKRVTRAGMGLCQGQTCQRLVSQILASELGLPPAEVEPSTSRAPVRPIRLSVFATG